MMKSASCASSRNGSLVLPSMIVAVAMIFLLLIKESTSFSTVHTHTRPLSLRPNRNTQQEQSQQLNQQSRQQQQQQLYHRNTSNNRLTVCYNGFLKDMFGKAFENDRSLSSDKSQGQYDKPGEEYDYNDEERYANTQLTETQLKWRQSQMRNGVNVPTSTIASAAATMSQGTMMIEMLQGKSFQVDLFLSGVPDKDPSNDLYGSKVNISSRDRDTNLSIPSKPTATVTIDLLASTNNNDGTEDSAERPMSYVCKCSASDFTAGDIDGQWKISDDGKMLRFSIDTLGYTRIVETKGTIQKIAWSKEDEKSLQTSSSYNIPPGYIYCDVNIELGAKRNQPNSITFTKDSGIIRLEKPTGLFGISSKMVACGKFQIQEVQK